MMTSALPTVHALEVNTGSNVSVVESPSLKADVATEDSSCRDVMDSCRSEKMPDRDDVITISTTFPRTDAISAGATGSGPIDSSDVSLMTPTSGREDNDEVRVRFRFDSVSCAGVDQKDVTPTCPLPKEPHPVRDQTVYRRFSPRDDIAGPDATGSETQNNIRLSLPPTSARQLLRTSPENVEEDRGEVAAPPRPRWLFRRGARGHRREKPSSALRKEIKAARQLGVIMGAFTVCFLPYFLSIPGPARYPSSRSQATYILSTRTYVSKKLLHQQLFTNVRQK